MNFGFNVNVQMPGIHIGQQSQVNVTTQSQGGYLQNGWVVSLKSHFNSFLRADPNLTVNLANHRQEWESWTVEQHGNKFAFRSHHGTYLRADPNLTANLAQHRQEWELWSLESHGNRIALKSHHNTYLRADPNLNTNLANACQDWEKWTVEIVSGGSWNVQTLSPQQFVGRRFYLQSQLGPVAHVHGGMTFNGAKCTLWDQKTHGHQANLQWTLSPAQNGAYYLESCVDQSFVLHQHGGNNDNGGEVTTWDKRTHGHQGNTQVTFQNVGGEWFAVRFVHSGKCLHVHGAQTANGTPLTQWDYVDQPNLKWKFVPL